MGSVQLELAAGEALDVGGQAAGVAAVADERLGQADEASAAGGEAQPEVPVLGYAHRGLEAAGRIDRGAAQHHARGRDRVGLVEQRRELVAGVQSGAQLGPALAGRAGRRSRRSARGRSRRPHPARPPAPRLGGRACRGARRRRRRRALRARRRNSSAESRDARAAAGPPHSSRRTTRQCGAWSGCNSSGSGEASSTTTTSAGAGS